MGYKSDNKFIHRHRAKWLFIERGRSMTGHSIGVVEAPWRFPDPVSARRLTKYWSVSSAGRPDGIDFQTNVDWISTKMNDAQQVPRGYLHAPAGITCYLHLCIRPVRSLSQPRFSSGEPSPGQNLFRPPGNRINYGALQGRWIITRLRFSLYVLIFVINVPPFEEYIFGSRAILGIRPIFVGVTSPPSVFTLPMSSPLLFF